MPLSSMAFYIYLLRTRRFNNYLKPPCSYAYMKINGLNRYQMKDGENGQGILALLEAPPLIFFEGAATAS